MTSEASTVLRLICKTQSYDWGKVGSESQVAQLASSTAGFTPRDDAPYAELWMGTHPSGASVSVESQEPLKSLLTQQNLGPKMHAKYEGDLPFLFKILSIGKALSIQAHPDKALAKELFAKRPDLYKDDNHKPEMAVAITPFEAFVGFRPLHEIATNIKAYPEFASLIGQETAQKFLTQVSSSGTSTTPEDVQNNKAALKAVFQALMECSQEALTQHLRSLIGRIEAEGKYEEQGSLPELVVRLNRQFPDDVGIFCALLLNYVKLQPGEGIFLAANEPHAYLSGDCVECMAASDNVVRSGLTPKFKDVSTLVRMLTYNYTSPEAQILRGDPYDDCKRTVLYDPPIEEFSILRTNLKAEESEVVKAIAGPSVVIVTEGSGKIKYTENGAHREQSADKGYVFFVAAGLDVELEAKGEDFVSYRAFCA
ncbi:Mannose-6-phosphate isomerase [Rhizophlyctis rosea]|uniref:Mannose-6-phosphate isomerase n=1 Tax=Rhizophlyctis rosea TaxID=64517 RepID=A0AAD5SMD5_9FUNG|nr:Mannose-6-phosphate isomerase [Rhizophlyctis rosea]